MQLQQWINSFSREKRRGVREEIADLLDVTESAVRHYANGTRPVPAERAPEIEEFTRNYPDTPGVVSREESCPEIQWRQPITQAG